MPAAWADDRGARSRRSCRSKHRRTDLGSTRPPIGRTFASGGRCDARCCHLTRLDSLHALASRGAGTASGHLRTVSLRPSTASGHPRAASIRPSTASAHPKHCFRSGQPLNTAAPPLLPAPAGVLPRGPATLPARRHSSVLRLSTVPSRKIHCFHPEDALLPTGGSSCFARLRRAPGGSDTPFDA